MRTTMCVWPLSIENPEIISVIRLGCALLGTLPRRVCQTRWDQRLAGVFPIQPVAPAGSTHEPRRVLQHPILIPILGSIFLLRVYVPATDLNGIQFVGAYASRMHLDWRLTGVEA